MTPTVSADDHAAKWTVEAERLGERWARELARATRLETSAALRGNLGRAAWLRGRADRHRDAAERFRRRHEAALHELASAGLGMRAQLICSQAFAGAMVLPAIAEARVRARYTASRMDLLSILEAARLTA